MIKSESQKNMQNTFNQNNFPKSFEPSDIENKWYKEWSEKGYFKTQEQPDTQKRESYSIQFPPPNVTGTLHMGHAFNQTIMDCLIRYNRMLGKDIVFIPGTDHAGIATQIVVERQLENKNLSRELIGKEKFIKEVWEWKKKSGNVITDQIKRLGISANWEREYFTMDEGMSIGVIETFITLYNQGLIYRGKRLVNWDPKLLTAVSDLEVEMEEIDGYMWYIQYPIVEDLGDIKNITIATTRPETIFADNALCVHPLDKRYNHLVGKYVYVPLTNRKIPIISDDFVDMEFGTGCVKITSAHDFNDYQCALRNNLPTISIFTKEAHLNSNVPEKYQGLERYEARKIVVEDLKNINLLLKIENHKTTQPKGDRSGVVLEPMLTDQWFLATTKIAPNNSINPGKSISEVALEVVENNQIKFYPEHWKNTYKQWLINIQDWCISRQLWWGHQIPAWYSDTGEIFVAHNEEEAYKNAKLSGYEGFLRRDDDVLDTWFSSALIPFTTMGWPENTSDLQKYLPSSVIITGFDIIFFWIARMVMLTKHITGKIPFRNIYIHGLIRDSEGKKMSKSKGNTLDPIDLIDGITLENLIKKRTFGLINPKQANTIEKNTKKEFPNGIKGFGTDALRFTMASYATLGRDINFDIKRCEGYRNFCNKIWNATRFVLLNIEDIDINLSIDTVENQNLSFADKWIISSLQNVIIDVNNAYDEYRFDNIANLIYKFIWDEFCDWYLEIAKVQMQNTFTKDEQNATKITLLNVLGNILKLLHPIMPYITEELWQKVSVYFRDDSQENLSSIVMQSYPKADKSKIDVNIEKEFLELKSQIDAVRALRGAMNLSPAEKVPLLAKGNIEKLKRNSPYIIHFAKLSTIEIVEKLPLIESPVQIIGDTYLMLNIKVDLNKELLRLEKEHAKILNEITKSNIKLNNKEFKQNAPKEIVAKEINRLEIFQLNINNINEQIEKLRKMII
ncbi:valyl-tRNA synthetase [Candidatus Kinetoplastibacterium desouzaii TCC079E]|uniref:Valine--tRNA ligase n=1 Tax=Candidatus Kinetoplastidibacterium desouzai TCC079E TaxID=1208919 RepID=M1LMJ1_9PROT|nr:valine--tRNA ligase [Candidatus Kinetoplastibacterium desouzaii]AGF46947.1 valyl-tRNA synthetase [Candidatus Kinetoplastibacterium desouzaii TCC079E]